MQGLCVDVIDLIFQRVFSNMNPTHVKFIEYLELARDCLRDAANLSATCQKFRKVYQKNNYRHTLHVNLNLRDPAQSALFNGTCRNTGHWCTFLLPPGAKPSCQLRGSMKCACPVHGMWADKWKCKHCALEFQCRHNRAEHYRFCWASPLRCPVQLRRECGTTPSSARWYFVGICKNPGNHNFSNSNHCSVRGTKFEIFNHTPMPYLKHQLTRK